MRILVPTKQVLDANVPVRIRADGTGIDLSYAMMSMNPFDAVALEAALRLREAGFATEVTAVSIGTDQSADTLRTALAMGSDRAILVKADGIMDSLAIAKILKTIVTDAQADLVIMGQQASDDDRAQTGQMLAALLGWGQGAFASSLTLTETEVMVTCPSGTGSQKIALPLPSVVTVALDLHQPRHASLAEVMRTRKKPIEVRPLAGFDVDAALRLEVLGVEAPQRRRNCEHLPDAATLVERLWQAGVL